MEIYYVFELSAHNSTKSSWYLKGVFTHDGLTRFKHEMQMVARNAVVKELLKNEPVVPEKPVFFDEFNYEDAEAQMKVLRKQVNAKRLEGEFDKFISLGQEIHDIRERQKVCKAYEKANNANEKFWENVNDILMGKLDSSPMVKSQLHALASRMVVFTATIDDELLNKRKYLNFYITRDASGQIDISYTKPFISDYEPYKRALNLRQVEIQRLADSIVNAEQDYDNIRAKLDAMDKSNPDFRKIFKETTKAYIKMRHLQDMLQDMHRDMDAIEASAMQKFMSRVTEEILRVDCILHDDYHVCRYNQSLYWSSDVPYFSSTRILHAFGKSVRLFD